jgi:hypothetical protein
MWRRLVLLTLGIWPCGCAAITQDVDAYYRQMAVNYKEAIERAKIEELSLENQSRVFAVTGDDKQHRRARRELDRVRSWEEHCAREQQRFEKAAKWMESHFDSRKSDNGKASGLPDASHAAHPTDPQGGGSQDTRGALGD